MSSDHEGCCFTKLLYSLLYYIGPLVFLFYFFKFTGLSAKICHILSSLFVHYHGHKTANIPEVVAVKTSLFETLHTGSGKPVILEVGAGDCRNLEYYPKGSELIVVEPNTHHHPAIRHRAAEVGAHVHLKQILSNHAEKLGEIENESVDAYVMTHVTCAVKDLDAALAEAKRVLRKGGHLYIYHHYLGPNKYNRSWQALFERYIIAPIVCPIFGGESDRYIEGDIKKHFPVTEVKIVELPYPMITNRYHLIARSTK